MTKIKNEEAPQYNSETINTEEQDKVIAQALSILRSRIKVGEVFSSARAVREYLILKMTELQREEFGCLFLTNQHELIESEIVATGTIDCASVYPREVLKKVLQYNAAAVIFYHNHPSGLCEPSQADKAITKKLKDALSMIDVRVLDHIIIAGVEVYGFADNGLM